MAHEFFHPDMKLFIDHRVDGVVAKQRGPTGGLPPYIAVGRGIPKDVVRIVEGWGGGKLGRAYDPLMVACSDEGQAELPSLKRARLQADWGIGEHEFATRVGFARKPQVVLPIGGSPL